MLISSKFGRPTFAIIQIHGSSLNAQSDQLFYFSISVFRNKFAYWKHLCLLTLGREHERAAVLLRQPEGAHRRSQKREENQRGWVLQRPCSNCSDATSENFGMMSHSSLYLYSFMTCNLGWVIILYQYLDLKTFFVYRVSFFINIFILKVLRLLHNTICNSFLETLNKSSYLM